MPVWDAEKNAARSINLSTIKRIAVNGETHIYAEETDMRNDLRILTVPGRIELFCEWFDEKPPELKYDKEDPSDPGTFRPI